MRLFLTMKRAVSSMQCQHDYEEEEKEYGAWRVLWRWELFTVIYYECVLVAVFDCSVLFLGFIVYLIYHFHLSTSFFSLTCGDVYIMLPWSIAEVLEENNGM